MRRVLALGGAIVVLGLAATPPAAAASGPGSQAASGALGSITGLGGDLPNPVSGAGNPIDDLTTSITGEAASLALGVFAAGVLGGAGSALRETAHVISRTTAPRLQSTWFSSTYWRVAGLAGLLSLPFLFAATAQALLRADPLLLARAVFGYLPLAVIAVNLAAPITMLLLSATDEMSSVIAGAGMGGGVHFLQQTAELVAGLSALDGSPFLAIAIGLLTLAAAVALAVEMLIREAAVYVVVLMLPLAFAALVWPARRSWAVRLIELLVALILSKFVIVAVLSLAGAAYGTSGAPTTTRLLTAMTLVLLSTFAPWVMLRLLPFTELAAGAAGGIRGEVPRLAHIPVKDARKAADTVTGWAESLPQLLRRQSGQPETDEPSSGGESGRRTAASAATERLAAQGSRAAEGSGQVDALTPTGPSSDAREVENGSASDGAATTRAGERRGPFSEMEPMWQFDDLTPNWIALDNEGVRRVAGPETTIDHGPPRPELEDPRPEAPGANETEADERP